MANTYTQINIHAVFSVKGRENFILPGFEDRLYAYMAGILKSMNLFSLAVNGYKDHVHLFFELSPNHSLSEIIRVVKANSSKWMNKQRFIPGHFNWQEGYGAFSYSRSQRDRVINYILEQDRHHRQVSFREEYLALLKKFEIEYKDQFVFDFFQ